MDPQDEAGQNLAALPESSHPMRLRSHPSPNPGPAEATAAPTTAPEPDRPLAMRVSRPRRPRRQMTLPEESNAPEGNTPRPQQGQNSPQAAQAGAQGTPTRAQRTPNRPRTSPSQDPLGSLGSIEQECIGWGLEDTPTRSNRVWSSRRPNNAGWDFEIYEDPPDRASPNPPTPPSPIDPDENKENIYATASDYESSQEEVVEENVRGVDFDRVNEFAQNAFGPVEDAPPLRSLYVDEQGQVRRSITGGRVPVPTNTTVRPAMRVEVTDNDAAYDEWDAQWLDELEGGQINELQELGLTFGRGVVQRHDHGNQYPLRDSEAIQGPTNVFSEARRITEVQRNPRRFRFADDEEDGANRATGIRRVVRRRPQDDEDEDEDEEN